MMETAVQHPLHDALHEMPFKSDNALQALHEFSIPTTRDEVWKYTRVARLLQQKWKHITPVAGEKIDREIPANWSTYTINFLHGVCQNPSGALEDGVEMRHDDVPDNTAPNHYFEAVAAAAYTSSIVIEVGAGVSASQPILIRHWIQHDGNFALPRIELKVRKGARVQVIEQFMSDDTSRALTLRTMHASVEQGAQAEWMKFQDESEHTFLMNHENVDVYRDAHFAMHTISWRSGWVRNQLYIQLHETGAFAKLNGIFLPRNNQFVDNHTRVDHIAPHGESSELYKGILMDRGIGVFNGKVHVHPQAQKTNAFQKNANMLIHPEAQMNTKPELEIYADDVKCSHGSTTGRMDTEALFYLKSRGIGEMQAQKLLSRAFIGEVIDQLPNDQVRDWAYQTMVHQELIFE